MTVGEKAILHIPPNYGYGDYATGPIPAKSHLEFTLELLSATDDSLASLKWQILGAVLFTLFILYFVVPHAS